MPCLTFIADSFEVPKAVREQSVWEERRKEIPLIFTFAWRGKKASFRYCIAFPLSLKTRVADCHTINCFSGKRMQI
jgi:hypothetical protein